MKMTFIAMRVIVRSNHFRKETSTLPRALCIEGKLLLPVQCRVQQVHYFRTLCTVDKLLLAGDSDNHIRAFPFTTQTRKDFNFNVLFPVQEMS